MFYIVYKISHRVSGRFYIGVHKTCDLNDEYMGSGLRIRRAIAKEGSNFFLKEILFICNNEEDMYSIERELVTSTFLKRSDVYNLSLGGKIGSDNPSKGGSANTKPQVDARLRNLKKACEIVIQEYRNGLRKSPLVGRQSEMTERALSEASRRKRKETFARKGSHIGSKNSQYGSFWITDGFSNRKIRSDIPDGWRRGRITRL